MLQTRKNQDLFEKRLTLLNDKILDQSELKVIADDKNKCDSKIKIVQGRVENIEGKGENAGD